jgi:hypothetical protein
MATSPITMAFAFVTSEWDLRALMNKWYHVGNGGKDVTDELLLLRKAVIKHWKTLSTDEKTTVMLQLHSPGLNLTNWDIAQMVENKNEWTVGITAPHAPETLTYKSNVYATAEVNYLLWGLVHRLAFDDNIFVYQSNYQNMISEVAIYRSFFGWAINSWQMYNGNLNMFETTEGKMRWADYGWKWATDVNADVPTGTRIHQAVPSSIPWTSHLNYNIANINGSSH